jgi:hypothetical protein
MMSAAVIAGLVLPVLLRAVLLLVLLPVAFVLAKFVPPFSSGTLSHNTRLYTIFYYTTNLSRLQY